MAADPDTMLDVSDTIVVGGDLTDDPVDESGADHDSTVDHESNHGSGEHGREIEQIQTAADTKMSASSSENFHQADAPEELAAENEMHLSHQHESPPARSQEPSASALSPVDDPTSQGNSIPSPASLSQTAPAIAVSREDHDMQERAFAADSPDIQELIEGITESTKEPESNDEVPKPSLLAPQPIQSSSTASPEAAVATPIAAPIPTPAAAVAGPASLPPKPSLPPKKAFPEAPNQQDLASHKNLIPAQNPSAHSVLPAAAHDWAAGVPGATPNAASYMAAQFNAQGARPQSAAGAPHPALQEPYTAHDWETFQAEEKQYTQEAKWERFPEGTRIFIGNLVSEKVSKRHVFDVFSKFGRLAQIALKCAYGFVQYHNVEDAQKAMAACEGVELGGRAIHLEVSRPQKEKKDRGDRGGSPGDRRNSNRGNRGDRYDGRDQNGRHGRDDYRPRRSQSPRRHENRGGRDGYGRGGRDRDYRGSHDRRGRSRSPDRFGRNDGYRRRSPSPRRMSHDVGMNPGPHMRPAPQATDVHLLLMHQLDRQFVDWVEQAFQSRGLRTSTMWYNAYVNDHQGLMNKLAADGYQGFVELTMANQTTKDVNLTVFNRSVPGKITFDRYDNLDPFIAANLLRERSQRSQVPPNNHTGYPAHVHAQMQPPNYAPQVPQYPPYGGYHPQGGHLPGYPQGAQQHQHQPQPQPPAAPAAVAYPDAAQIRGLDNATLQTLLNSMNGQRPANAGGAAQAPQIDVNALLGNLRAAGPGAANPYAAYGPAANGGNPGAPAVQQHVPMNGVGANGANGNPHMLVDPMNRYRTQ